MGRFQTKKLKHKWDGFKQKSLNMDSLKQTILNKRKLQINKLHDIALSIMNQVKRSTLK